MSILSIVGQLFTGGVVDKVVDLVKDFQDKKLSRDELEFKLSTLAETQAQELKLAQITVNRQEAAHESLFVAGWRPALGWICGLGFFVNFLVAPIGTFIASILGSTVVFPMADLSTMIPIILGMLGLGGLRTIEKTKGVSRER